MKAIRQDDEMKRLAYVRGALMSLNKIDVLVVIISLVIIGIIIYGIWLPYTIEV